MPTEHMFTDREYVDGIKVPYLVYKCPRPIDLGHPCKLVVDHDGEHLCTCGRKRKQGKSAVKP